MKKIYCVNGKKNIKAFLFLILLPLVLGMISGYISMSGERINYVEPWFTPPDFVFPIVWTILYIFMGIASYRVWMKRNCTYYDSVALLLYFIQLIFNFMWSIIFFRLALINLAFIWIILLLVLVILTTIKFFKIDEISGWLMVPYIIWLLIATMLNYCIVILN